MFIPAPVQKMVDYLTKETEVEPVVTRHLGGFLLSHSNEHVAVTIFWRLNGRHWRWVKSTLTIDGERVPLAESHQEYVRIFKLGRRPTEEDREFTPVVLEELEILTKDEIPAQLHKVISDSEKTMEKVREEKGTEVDVRCGRDSEGHMVVEFKSDKATVRLLHEEGLGGRWLPTDNPLRIVLASGRDVSKSVGNLAMDEVLKLLIGETPKVEATPTIGRPRPTSQAKPNSVMVRNTTVIRV